MKKLSAILLTITVIIAILILALNTEVTTRQGINYQWHTVKLPLYLKALDFFDRHYNYKRLVNEITNGSKIDEERVMKIFEWTHKNIRKTPPGYPVIDDHVWHIIVRGYGEDDQSCDVFTSLCNYAGMDAFYSWVDAKNHDSRMALSFVRVNGGWGVFDPYEGIYFKNNKGEFVDIEEILKGDWLIASIDSSGIPNIDYSKYLSNLQFIRNIGFSRGSIQSPIKRLKYEIKKWLR